MSIFSKIQLFRPKYSTFDLSYDNKLSFKMGYLVPVHLQETVPGDQFFMSSQAMFRMMPLVAPIMHKVDVFMHFFFVPNRILWPNWEKWITGGEDPDVNVPAFPTISWNDAPYNTIPVSSLGDYLGMPTGIDLETGQVPVSALPLAAYQRIWYEFYRDQNLITGDPIILPDGVITDSTMLGELFTLQKRAWEHDYFTACLPFAQKGDAVTLPLDLMSKNPISPTGYSAVLLDSNGGFQTFQDQSGNLLPNEDVMTGAAAELQDSSATTGLIDPGGTLGIDPSDLTGTATLNDLRTAEALQRWLEKNARAGTRYIESILAHFGIRSSDKRLQRPEYLGGSKAAMSISEVLQTSESATTAQGTMAGHGISVSGGKSFNYRCEEHGYIMGLLSVRPKTAYFQGLPRHFSKTTDRTQYYWPDFAHLGEQAVLNQEIYTSTNPTYNSGTFGYIPRYAEYRYNPSRVAGQFRTTLDFWHMGRKFATPPSLNQSFVEMDPDKRIFAVTNPNDDEIVAHIYHQIKAKRPLPYFANPGLL